jgi:alpha-tubulin suppressor-like RCC1 family protein
MNRLSQGARIALTLTVAAVTIVGSRPAHAQAALHISSIPPSAVTANNSDASIARTVVSVAAWGDNSYGELGDGTTTSRSAWAPVSSLTGVTKIAAGHNHNLVVMADGTVRTWGFNGAGQLGYGYWVNSTIAKPVPGLTGVIAVAGGWLHSLAVKSDGSVWAWGDNQYGELGDGTTNLGLTPVRVTGLTGVVKVAAGNGWSLALKSDGTVWAWGVDTYGILGNNPHPNSLTPVQVNGLSHVTDIAAGSQHALALETDASGQGTVWAWGQDFVGQIGNGDTCLCSFLLPVQVPGLPSAAGIAGGDLTSVALGSDGSVWTWGANLDGALGDGSTTSIRPSPAQIIAAGSGIIRVAAGGNHSVALKANGTVVGWGSNGSGELGTNPTMKHSTIVTVLRLTGVTAVAAGSADTLAIYDTPPVVK